MPEGLGDGMRRIFVGVLALGCLWTCSTLGRQLGTGSAARTAATKADKLPNIPFEKYKLKNGLEVILSEDHTLPLVSVNI